MPQRAGDGHLAGAQQRHAVEAQAAGGDGGEVGVEVVGEGEDAADDVVGTDLVAGHDLAHELLGSVEDGGRLVDVDGGGAAQGEEAHRGAIMPVMRRAAVALLVCLAGCGGGEKLKSAAPVGAAPAHGHEPGLPGQRSDPGALLVRRRQGAAGAALRRRPRRRGRAGARGRRPRRGRLRALDRLRHGARHAHARRHRAARRGARGRELDRLDGLDAALPAQRHAPLRVPPVLAEAQERPRRRAPSRTTSSPRCARAPAAAACWWAARDATRAAERPRASLRSRSTSAAVSRRWRPAARSPRRSDPKATRRRSTTRWPTASHIRRTWRLRPSWIVSSSSCGPSRRTWAGAVRPSSSSMPSRSARRARSLGRPSTRGPIGPRDLEARVGERVGEVAVVGEQDQAGAVGVQAPDGVQALAGGHEVDDGGPPVGVGRRGDHPGRLVQRVDDARARPAHELAVDRDRLVAGDVARRVGDHGAVDGHPPVDDERLRRAPRRDAGVSQVLSEAHGHMTLAHGSVMRRDAR